MADIDVLTALRESVARAVGSPRTEPARADGKWRHDWPALVELGAASVLDPDEGSGPDGLPLAVGLIQELACALHPFPGHALVPVAAVRAGLESALGERPADAVVALTDASADLRVEGGDEGVVITGTTDIAAGLDGVSHLLLLREGAPAAVLDVSTTECHRETEQNLDVTRSFQRIRLDTAPARIVHGIPSTWLGAVSRLLLAADAVAVATQAVDRTVSYAGERRAFGQPIGRFQAVQHRLVEHAIVVGQLRDLVEGVTDALVGCTPEAAEQLALLETFCYERVPDMISDCIQLTGAIGFTWEYGLHFAQRRALGNATLAGGAGRARRRLATLSGW